MDDTNTNGHLPLSPDPVDALRREVVVLRARCSNLRHWCDAMIDDPAAAGAIDEATAEDVRAVPPAIGETEAHELIGRLTRGGDVPAAHPLVPATADPNELRAAVAARRVEHERLRSAFFALYDRLYPGDDLTDEYFLAQQWDDSVSISDLIAELERETGAES